MAALWLPLLAAISAAAANPSGPILTNTQELVTPEDYPLVSLQNEEQGNVTVKVGVDPTGVVTTCKVVKSSGHPALDAQTCSLFRARARFEPAKDRRGRPTTSSYTQTIVWMLAGNDAPEMPRQAWMFRTTISFSNQGQIVGCKTEATGATRFPDDCSAVMAVAGTTKGGDAHKSEVTVASIYDVYFYPVDPHHAPVAPKLTDATEIARQVSKIEIAPTGDVTACEGIHYSGTASSSSDACTTIMKQRFDPASDGSKSLTATVIVTAYIRRQSVT